MATWVTDATGNKASVECWGSERRAMESLETLKNCTNCTDCLRCAGCTGCTGDSKSAFTVPVVPDIHKAVFAAVSVPGALNMGKWHTCDTTHCRAGWVVTLAGDAGKELEKKTSTLFAAMQIYKASGYAISPNRFYDDDKTAMADMKRLAEML